MTAAALASILHGRRVGKGRWIARCPAHSDRNPSLSIYEGKKVPVLLKCRSAGCDTKAILDALGLRWGDLFYDAEVSAEVRKRLGEERRLAGLKDRLRVAAWFAEWLPACEEVGKWLPSTPRGITRDDGLSVAQIARKVWIEGWIYQQNRRIPEDRRLSRINGWYWWGITLTHMGPEYRKAALMRKSGRYWKAALAAIESDIRELREKADPDLERERRLQEKIQRLGFEKMWENVYGK